VGVWGVPPASFWDMDLEEWWWLYEVKQPREERDNRPDYAELYELIK
jgi:hypothetical protein